MVQWIYKRKITQNIQIYLKIIITEIFQNAKFGRIRDEQDTTDNHKF